jgi:hypothetical protein
MPVGSGYWGAGSGEPARWGLTRYRAVLESLRPFWDHDTTGGDELPRRRGETETISVSPDTMFHAGKGHDRQRAGWCPGAILAMSLIPQALRSAGEHARRKRTWVAARVTRP